MSIVTVRRLAADILGVGENKVWISPEKISEVSSALTRDDVRALIKQGTITAKKLRGTSRARGKVNDERKRKGRKGPGSIKGAKGARVNSKDKWMSHVRAQRKYLRQVKLALTDSSYRMLYRRVKGGSFQSRAQLMNFIKDNNLMK
jgi:large subunit ribosomal protein L19e